MSPIINEFAKRKEFVPKVLLTGQHGSMLEGSLGFDKELVVADLSSMKSGQALSHLTSKILHGAESVMKKRPYRAVFVHGDTTSAFSAALAAFYLGIKVCHVEAGLRTYDHGDPFPEEFNRSAIARLASLHFAPTDMARDALLREGISEGRVFVTGNTAIDALLENIDEAYSDEELSCDKKLILLTLHRRECKPKDMDAVFSAVAKLSLRTDVRILYPVHKSERVRSFARKKLLGTRVRLIEPVLPRIFHNYVKRSYMVITDSGGIQEEAAFLGKPIILTRNVTERKELLSYSGLKLVGFDENLIYNTASQLLDDEEFYKSSSKGTDIFGVGDAASKIADAFSLAAEKGYV